MTCRVIGKIYGRVIGVVLIVTMFSRNGYRWRYCARQQLGVIASCLCVIGGELEECGYGKVTYVG